METHLLVVVGLELSFLLRGELQMILVLDLAMKRLQHRRISQYLRQVAHYKGTGRETSTTENAGTSAKWADVRTDWGRHC